jgi:hypothetical protein
MPQAFPELEAVMRAAYPPSQGYAVRTAKGTKTWCILVQQRWTTGFRIDFFPVNPLFGPPEAVVAIRRHCRLGRVARYLTAVGLCAVLAGAVVGKWTGWWARVSDPLPSAGITVGFVLVPVLLLILPAIARFCMRFRGGVSDDQLTAVGQTAADVLNKPAGAQSTFVSGQPATPAPEGPGVVAQDGT